MQAVWARSRCAVAVGHVTVPWKPLWVVDWFGNGEAITADSTFGGADPDRVSGVFSRVNWAARLRDITDGTSKTIAWLEIRQYCTQEYVGWLGWADARAMWYATTAPINFPTCVGENGVTGTPGAGGRGCKASRA